MESAITRKVKKKGYRITVVMRKKDFDVFIEVTPRANISQKTKFDKIEIKFKAAKNMEITETIRIEHRNVKYSKGSAYNNVRLKHKAETYTCEISLPPMVYVPDDVLRAAELERANRQPKKPKVKKIKMGGLNYRPGMASGSKTNYSNTNVARPYVGGRCSPK